MGELPKFSVDPAAAFEAQIKGRNALDFALTVENYWRFEARNRFGDLLWVEDIANLIPDAGANDLLTQYLKGAAYTAGWFVGLIDNTGFTSLQNSDTAAKITTATPTGGTNSWQENTGYSNAARVAATFGAAAARSLATSAPSQFNINATVVLTGGFLISNSTKAGTTGVLYGEGSFSVNRSLANFDTLSVSVTATA